MKKQLIVLAFLIVSNFSFSQNYNKAVGLRYSSYSNLGGPAFSYKQFIKNNTAIEAIVSISNPVAIGALYQKYNDLGTSTDLQWYYGVGGYFAFSKPKAGVGAAGIIGIDYKFDNTPINISLDFKPELRLAPSVGLDFNTFGFAIRYVIK